MGESNEMGAASGVLDGVLSTIGRTPLVRLRRLLDDESIRLFAKLEALNPGGSVKDRPALAILQSAMESGEIDESSVVIESSSGNMGIGLAQVCRYYGLRFICVVDPLASEQNLKILRAYGAEVERVTEPDARTGQYLQARIDRVRTLRDRIPGAFWPNQYENRKNPESHYRTTMEEVVRELNGEIDYLFLATSTCGTLRGCGDFVRDHGMNTRIVAVDALGSRIFQYVEAKRLLPGMGAGMRPPLCDRSMVHECIHVSDLDCVEGCRTLMEREAIFVGASSGGIVSAVLAKADDLPSGATCVLVLCDRGERYLDTVYDDAWVERNCRGAGQAASSPGPRAATQPAPAKVVSVSNREGLIP